MFKNSLAFLLWLMLSATNAAAYSLADAILSTHENNPKIKQVQEDKKASSSAEHYALGAFAPQVSYNISNQYSPNGGKIDINRRRHYVSITQNLLSGGEHLLEIQKSGIKTKRLDYELIGTVNQELFSAIAAYQGVNTSRFIYKISQEFLKSKQEYLKMVQIGYETGVATITDVAQVEANLAASEADCASIHEEMISAQATFQKVVGVSAPEVMETVVGVKSTPPLEASLIDALRNNQSLLATKQLYEISRKDMQLAYADMLPTADFQADIGSGSGIDDTGQKYKEKNYKQYSLSVRVPIFQGGMGYNVVKMRSHQRDSARYRVSEVEQSIRQAVIKSWNEYSSSAIALASHKKSVDAAERALSGVMEEAKLGSKSPTDVLKLQDDLFISKIKQSRALDTNILNGYKIYALTGRLHQIVHL